MELNISIVYIFKYHLNINNEEKTLIYDIPNELVIKTKIYIFSISSCLYIMMTSPLSIYRLFEDKKIH